MACVNDMGQEAEKGPRIVYLGFVERQLFNPPDDETNAPCPDRGGPGRRWKHSNVQAATVGVCQCACTLLDVAERCSGPRLCRVCLSEEAFLLCEFQSRVYLSDGAKL